MVLPADTITRQRIEIDEKRHVGVAEWVHVKWRFVIFAYFSRELIACVIMMCVQQVWFTTLYGNTKAFKSNIISNLYSFSYPLIIVVVVVLFTWHGEQPEFSSTVRVRQKKHVSKYTLSDQKRSKKCCLAGYTPRVLWHVSANFSEKSSMRKHSYNVILAVGQSGHRQRQDVSAGFGLGQTFGLI